MSGKFSHMPVVVVRVEPNLSGTKFVWSLFDYDGTKASGCAQSPADAMHDAAAFVEAMMQPRRGGLGNKPKLKVVS